MNLLDLLGLLGLLGGIWIGAYVGSQWGWGFSILGGVVGGASGFVLGRLSIMILLLPALIESCWRKIIVRSWRRMRRSGTKDEDKRK